MAASARYIAAMLAILLAAQVITPYIPAPKPTWVIVMPPTISTFSAVAPLLFDTQADCAAAASQLGKGVKCIEVKAVR